MSAPLEIAEKYFELSNEHELDTISEMFTDASTYSSINTGVFLGRKQIMDMMKPFHDSFSELHWEIVDCRELRPGVVWLDFVMTGTKTSGEKVEVVGEEYVVVKDEKLLHVEVRNK